MEKRNGCRPHCCSNWYRNCIVGGVIGTIVDFRRARSDEERRYLLKWAIAFCFLIAAFLASSLLVPVEFRPWILVIYVLLLPIVVMAANRGHAGIQEDARHKSRDLVP